MKIAFLNITQGKVNRGAETFVAEVVGRLSQDSEVEVISDQKVLPARWPLLWRIYLDPHALLIAAFTIKNIYKLYQTEHHLF